jgi:2-keto-4-pentenoate hydratase/2-oxohepta-3-ene-1,7-dioic acid hydratase in catechol pathway
MKETMAINNIHCLALNYRGIGLLDQDPIYFLKSTSCLSKEDSTIPYPKYKVDNVWTEVELGILVGQDCEDVSEHDAYNVIEGFFVAGDITCNSIYDRDHHLAFSKSRTGFCPISSNVTHLDLRNKTLEMKTFINGVELQCGNTSDMIMNPYQSLSYISKLVKLNKGDIILTGTPTTINGGPQVDCLVKPNDVIKHSIESIGELNYKFSI